MLLQARTDLLDYVVIPAQTRECKRRKLVGVEFSKPWGGNKGMVNDRKTSQRERVARDRGWHLLAGKKRHLRGWNMLRSLSLPISVLMNPGLSRIFCI